MKSLNKLTFAIENVRHKNNIVPFNGRRYSIILETSRSCIVERTGRFESYCALMMIGRMRKELPKNEIIQYLSYLFLSFAREQYTTKEILKKLDSIHERKATTRNKTTYR